jgi:hypothetical protein
MALTIPDGKGYAIPSTIDPEAAVCIRVYVPADQYYIAAFWNSLDFFGKWVAWEKDDSHRAKDVAAMWRVWIDKTREEWDCSGGDCGMINVRQKPSEPCILQKQDTCGGAWVDFADLRLCAFGVDDMLYGEGESWREIDDILWQIKSWIELIDAWLTAGKSATEIKYLMAKEIGYLKGLETIIDNMAAMSEGERENAIDALDWDDIRASVYCDSEDCYVDYDTLDTYYDWLDCVYEWIFDTLNATENDLFNTLDATSDWIADALNLAPIARGGGGGGFGGIAPECSWSHDYDFEIGAYWDVFVCQSPSCFGEDVGEYRPPWGSTHVNFGEGAADVVAIEENGLEPSTWTRIEFEYTTAAQAAGIAFINYMLAGQTDETRLATQVANNDATETMVWSGSLDNVVHIKIGVALNGTAGDVEINYLKVQGSGSDPL